MRCSAPGEISAAMKIFSSVIKLYKLNKFDIVKSSLVLIVLLNNNVCYTAICVANCSSNYECVKTKTPEKSC